MADTTLGADCALSKRADETPQQHADRLLLAHRDAQLKAGANFGPTLNPTALDRLELGAVEISYVLALTHAVSDIAEDIRNLVRSIGPTPDENVYGFVDRMETLLSLQLDQCLLATASVSVAVDGWPTQSAKA